MRKLCLLICCFLSLGIYGETIQEVFQGLIEEMLLHNPRLQSREAQIRQQLYSIRESQGNLFAPEIDVYASRSTTRTRYDQQEIDDSKRTVEDIGIRLNYNLFRGFGDWYRLEHSRRQYAVARENWIYSAQGFLGSLIERYSVYLQSYHNLRVAEESFRENEKILEFFTEQRRLRLAVRSEYYLAKARFHEAEADFIRAENNLETARNNLERLLNIKVSEDDLIGELVPPDDQGYTLDLMNRPEYRLENYALEILGDERKMAESNFYPRLDFNTSYGHTDERVSAERRAWTVQLQLSMNLFRGFQDVNRLRRIDQEEISLEKGRIDVRRELETSFENALSRQKSARQDYLSSREYYKAMEIAYEAASEELRLQLISYPDFLTIQTSWIRARENYNNALLNLIFSDLDLQVLSGTWYDFLHQYISARLQ